MKDGRQNLLLPSLSDDDGDGSDATEMLVDDDHSETLVNDDASTMWTTMFSKFKHGVIGNF